MDDQKIRELLSKPVITPSQVSEVLPLAKNSVYRAIKNGDIAAIRMGGKIMIPTGPLRELLGIRE